MLFLAAAALLMPAIFELSRVAGCPPPGAEIVDYGSDVEQLSVAVAVGADVHLRRRALVLAAHPPRPLQPPDYEDEDTLGWSVRRSVIDARRSPASRVGVMSEVLVGSIAEASESIGLSEFFIGVIVVAIVGNAAEHWVAVLVAHKDKMDLAVNIAIGSSAQVALFVAPVLVLASFFVGPEPMALVFNGFELGAVLHRGADRQLRHPRGRVDVVRGRSAARRLRDPRRGFFFA